MKALLDRFVVLATSAVTYLVMASAALVIISEEIPGTAGTITKVVAWLGTAVAIIRRVTPVLKGDRGLLLPAGDEG